MSNQPVTLDTVHYDSYVEVCAHGTFDATSATQLVQEIARIHQESPFNVLLDLRDSKFDLLSYADIHTMINIVKGSCGDMRGKTAILDSFITGREKVLFFEAVAQRHEWQVRTFLEQDLAFVWLGLWLNQGGDGSD